MKSVLDILRLQYALDVGNWEGELPTLVLDAEAFNFGSIPEQRYRTLFGFPIVWRTKRTTPAKTETVYI